MKHALVVLLIHGGGWMGGSPDTMQPYADRLNAEGIPAATVRYRFNDLPGATRDVRRAIRDTRPYARRVVVYGGSAGGHLAAYAAARGWADAAVVVAGISDLTVWRTDLEGWSTPAHFKAVKAGSKRAKRRLSPVHRVTRKGRQTPAFLAYGSLDTFVSLSQGRALHRALPRSEFHIMRGVGHQWPEAWEKRALRWLLKLQQGS